MHARAELLGPGQRRRLRSAAPAATSPATSSASSLRAELRRDRAAGDGARPLARARRERLVQPRAVRQLHRQRTRPPASTPARRPSYSGPDSATASVTGSCRDRPATERLQRVRAQVRRDRPAGDRASPSRRPDANGWYNHALTSASPAADATSGRRLLRPGADLLRPGQRRTPRSAAPVATGRQHRPASLALIYDATGPQVTAHARSRARLERLVQPRATSPSPARTRPPASTPAFRPSLLRPGQRRRLGHGSCRDVAGNTSATSIFALKYDATAPRSPAPRLARPTPTAGSTTR